MIDPDDMTDVGLGTWVFDKREWIGDRTPDSVLNTAIDGGINVIDTAPIYGQGRSESIIGSVLADRGDRDEVFLSTKCGLNWNDENSVWRDGRPERLETEIEDSLDRLQTDWIDTYFIHWPDEEMDLRESIEALESFREEDQIRYVGLSNVNVEQIEAAQEVGTVDFLQPPFNLFEKESEDELFPFCREHDIRIMTYSTLCRGLLTGKYGPDEGDEVHDVRGQDPKFTDRRKEYVMAVRKIQQYLKGEGFDEMAPAVIRWTADQEDVTTALVGARNDDQIRQNLQALNLELSDEQRAEIREIAEGAIFFHVEPEFMAPPSREEVAKLL